MPVLPVIIYALCSVASLIGLFMLWRGYRRTGVKLILWLAWCFAGLSINNLLLVLDYFTPNTSLADLRAIPALAGVLALVYGLIRENT